MQNVQLVFGRRFPLQLGIVLVSFLFSDKSLNWCWHFFQGVEIIVPAEADIQEITSTFMTAQSRGISSEL